MIYSKEFCFQTGKAVAVFAVALLLTTMTAAAQSSDWAQWGGPQRNFKSESKGLATTWPETGPRRLWQRELGEGYSAIVAGGDCRCGGSNCAAVDVGDRCGLKGWGHEPARLQAGGCRPAALWTG